MFWYISVKGKFGPIFSLISRNAINLLRKVITWKGKIGVLKVRIRNLSGVQFQLSRVNKI